jgi:YidC/Oxa1 family membrane protein insertase
VERRFLTFTTLCLLVILLNGLWTARQAQQKEAARQAAAPQGAAADKPEPGVDQGAAPDAAAASDATSAEGPAGAADTAAAEHDAAGKDASEPEGAAPTEYVTLGSVDPASDYRLLVTLTNRGAAVRRIELSSPRYLDIQDRTGYLGHLEVERGGGSGLKVQAVGAGTPAYKAGVRVGDRLLEAGVKTPGPLNISGDLAAAYEGAKPGKKLTLVVDRNGERKTLEAMLGRRPLDVIRPESENVLLREKTLPPDFVEPPSFLFTLAELDDKKIAEDGKELAGVDLESGNWRITDRSDRSVTFERRAAGLTVTKRYELAKLAENERTDPDAPAYHLMLTVTIENPGEGSRKLAYRLDGPNGLPMEGWWYANKIGREWGAMGLRDIEGRYFDAAPHQIGAPSIVSGKATPFEGANAMAYIGVDAQYFCVALLPQTKDEKEHWIASATPILVGPKPDPRTGGGGRFANVTARLLSDPVTLAGGKSLTHEYQVFAGPKRPSLLLKYHAPANDAYSLNDFVYYGWFGGVARAMVGVLHFFYGIVHNYGVAIILLTVLVRGCMFPVSRGQARSMAKLQQLKPEMERIKEKYKGDNQKQAQAMQQLYRKHKVNPLGGCLPALIQLPVFVGLWRGLAVDIELRQAPLFGNLTHWCSNLAAPDMFYDWSWFMPDIVNRGMAFLVGLGPYLNLLPLATIALFLWQQKMFMPPPANEQAAAQQKTMKYVMIFMSLLFYKVPSGLCLYLISSSLWGIGERKLFPPPTTASSDGGSGGQAAPVFKKPSGGPSSDPRAGKNGQSGDKRGAKAKRRR